MFSLRKLIFFIVLSAVLGWMLGYLRFPYLEQDTAFFPIAVLCLLVFIFFIFIKSTLKIKSQQTTEAVSSKKNFLLLLVVFVIVIASVIFNIKFYKQNSDLEKQIHEDRKKIQELSAIIESSGSGNLSVFMNTILEEVDSEMKTKSVLSDSVIHKLATLSYSFKPHKIYEGDSISEKTISLERGQLLLALLMLDIDSVSFLRIKSEVSFAGANLNGADLRGVDLSNADLKGAHFKVANLKRVNLSGADLSDAVLYAANLDSAKLVATNFKRADMRWAMLNHAQLQSADLSGAQMMQAQFANAEMYRATIQNADLSGAIMQNANLTSANLIGSNLQRVNFKNAILMYVNMRLTNQFEAIYSDANLHKAIVDSTWMKDSPGWNLTGYEYIKEKYKLLNDTADVTNYPYYRLTEIYKDSLEVNK